MSIYYICSPYRGKNKAEVDRHIQYAKDLTRMVIMLDQVAITPHLYITECLNDSDRYERMIGCHAALELLTKCDAVIVGLRFGISEGMETEIAKAKSLNIPVIFIGKGGDQDGE